MMCAGGERAVGLDGLAGRAEQLPFSLQTCSETEWAPSLSPTEMSWTCAPGPAAGVAGRRCRPGSRPRTLAPRDGGTVKRHPGHGVGAGRAHASRTRPTAAGWPTAAHWRARADRRALGVVDAAVVGRADGVGVDRAVVGEPGVVALVVAWMSCTARAAGRRGRRCRRPGSGRWGRRASQATVTAVVAVAGLLVGDRRRARRPRRPDRLERCPTCAACRSRARSRRRP